jgi:tetratricopeptide (TPR) repeat protein
VKPRPDVVAAAARLRLRATLGVLLVLGVGTAGAEQREAVAQARVCFSAAGPAEIASCRAALRLGLSPAREALVEVTLANALAALGRWDEVIAVYREAVRRRPADGLAQLRLGLALVHGVDRPAEAEGALREAVRLRPADAEAWAGLGGALALLGRSEEAVAAFEAALAREAGHLDGRPAARALYEAAQKRVRWPPEREERP